MVLFSSDRTFTLGGLMLWPVAWQCSKKADYQGTGVLWSTTNSVQSYAQKEQKRHFALKFDLCWLKKQIQNYRGYIKVSVYHVLQREDVALNSMNQLTYWVLEFHSGTVLFFPLLFQDRKKKHPKKLSKSSKSIITFANGPYFVSKKLKKTVFCTEDEWSFEIHFFFLSLIL